MNESDTINALCQAGARAVSGDLPIGTKITFEANADNGKRVKIQKDGDGPLAVDVEDGEQLAINSEGFQ